MQRLTSVQSTVPFDHLFRATAAIDALITLCEDQSHAGLAAAQQESTFDAQLAAARAAIESAILSLAAWRIPARERMLGVTIGDHVFIGMEDIAQMSGATQDAARKWVREQGVTRYRFGRRKYVLLDELLAVVREEDWAAD